MNISTSAITYANSLIKADANYDLVLSDLNTINEVRKSSSEFRTVMENPAISVSTKFEIIDEIFKKDLSEKVLNFLKILIERNRFIEFEQILYAYSAELDEINNVKKVDIFSAIELSDNQKRRITEKLQTRLKKTIQPNWAINKDIIGGLVIKIDDDIIDTSLKSKLDKLSKI